MCGNLSSYSNFKKRCSHTQKNLHCHVKCETCELQVCLCVWNYTAYMNGHLINMIQKFKISFFSINKMKYFKISSHAS